MAMKNNGRTIFWDKGGYTGWFRAGIVTDWIPELNFNSKSANAWHWI
jgi:hypothetical protein